jgi:DNA-binding Xre family transcriptional regulator
VRWRVGELLKAKKWTRYRLVQESGLAVTVVYRIANNRGPVRVINGRTLSALCAAFDVGPGELLEYTPDSRAGGSRRVPVRHSTKGGG